MNTVTFTRADGTAKNSYTDWGLLLRPKEIAPPEPKIITMSIDGRDGDIDLTEWAGAVRYNDRAFSLSFYMTDAVTDINAKATAIKNWLHGQRVKITFSDDADYYYSARVSVTAAYNDGGVGVLAMSVIAAPYKYKQEKTSRRVWVVNGAAHVFSCDRMTARPRFTAEGETSFKVCGKNILQYPYPEATSTNNGITYTANADGTVTATGTATGVSVYFFQTRESPLKLSAGAYTFSGCPDGGGFDKYSIRGENMTSGTYLQADIGAGQTVVFPDDYTDIRLYITIGAGVTVDGLKFSPMIEQGESKTDYEQYKALPVSVSAGATEFASVLFREGANTIYGTGAGAFVTVEYQEGAL